MPAARQKEGRIGGRRAGWRDYETLFKKEHLEKFSAAEVGYADPSPVAQHCGGCVHWFQNPRTGWTPCEIMRLGGHHPVKAEAVCRFWNEDGRGYPLLNVL